MKSKVKVKYNGEKITIVNGRKKDDGQFYDGIMVKDESKTSAAGALNELRVSSAIYDEYAGFAPVIINAETGAFFDVRLNIDSTLKNDRVHVSSNVRDVLGSTDKSKLILCKNRCIEIGKVFIQRIDDIKEDFITVYNDDAEFVKSLSAYKFMEVVNVFTDESLVIKTTHIKCEKTTKPDDKRNGSIRLNRKQRQFLGLNVPQYLNDGQWDILKKNASADDFKIVEKLYVENSHNLIKEPEYNDMEVISKLIENFLTKLIIKPVAESFYYRKKITPLRCLANFYVGKSTISLSCRRPYEIDENSDIVRMSASNMKILGIEEMDKVVLRYKNREVVCRALNIDSEKSFLKSNRQTDIDFAVGIPAQVRKKLGVPDLLTVVKIDRYTPFIFMKTFNEQIIPIILTLFTSEFFGIMSLWLKIVLPIFLIPLVIYLNLSSKRNMRA